MSALSSSTVDAQGLEAVRALDDECVVIRIRKTTDANLLDLDVGYTEGMERVARGGVERIFGFIGKSRIPVDVSKVISKLLKDNRRELLQRAHAETLNRSVDSPEKPERKESGN